MPNQFLVNYLVFSLLMCLTGRAQDGVDEDRPRPDRPAQAAEYRALLVGGSSKADIPADSVLRAAEKIVQLRQNAAARFGIAPAAMMLQANTGLQITIGGIPVGPLLSTNIPLNGGTRVVPQAMPLESASSINPAGWKWLGPGNIGGRIRSVLIHPNQPQTIWVGGVAGGVWKTNDGGVSWSPLYDLMANVAISCMAIDPNNPDHIFAGTGEGFFNVDSIRGFGIFESDNGGSTWVQMPSTANDKFRFINRIAIASTSATSTIMLVATRNGVFRSTDGGTTFTAVPAPLNVDTCDVRFSPSDSQKAVAGTRGGLTYYSNNGGANWQASTGIGLVAGQFRGRVEMSYAKANADVVYASVDDGEGKIYRSTNGGASFVLRSISGHLKGQGWYANCLWAGDPSNPNLLVVGGLDLHRSLNGGTTFSKISQWQSSPTSAHADHHVILEHPNFNGTTNNTVYFGNDGGLYRAANILTVSETVGWQELNNGLGLTQFYGAAANPVTGKVIGGTQDNGTLYFSPPGNTESWTEVFGGDGGDSAFDPVTQTHYGEYIRLQIHRGQNGGTSNFIHTGIGDAGTNALFIAPFILDPNNSARMLAGGARLWRSNNVKDNPPSWQKIKDPAGTSLISAIAIAPGDSKTAWVATSTGAIEKTSTATSATPTWTNVLGLPARYCSRIVFDPHDSTKNTLYVTTTGYLANNLHRTSDGGATWTALGVGVLPEIPFHDLVVHPSNNKLLYLGTELGLFVSDDTGATWSPTNQGPTNAPVSRLFWINNTLYVATHGRGIFTIDLATPDANIGAPVAAAAIAP